MDTSATGQLPLLVSVQFSWPTPVNILHTGDTKSQSVQLVAQITKRKLMNSITITTITLTAVAITTITITTFIITTVTVTTVTI